MKPIKIDAAVLNDALMTSVDELIVVVNKDGYIESMSKAYAEFLHVDRKNIIGRHVSEVIENTRMDVVIKTGVAEIGELQEVNGEKMIASRIPIIKDGEVVGAFGRVLFRSARHLQELYNKVSTMEQELNLYKKAYGKLNAAKYAVDDIIGACDIMDELKESVRKVAKTNSGVLILGESGTGKELFAHSIHKASARHDNPLICINCGTIPEHLMESEFFGYEEGSFTGAKKGGKTGLFQEADGGTVFLDEIGDLPLSMQVKLLRVLQDKEIQKIGSGKREPLNIRIVAATNKNLYSMVEEGTFRSDLYYRLNVVTLHIPALRERKSDIPLLVNHLLHKIAKREGIRHVMVPPSSMELLAGYEWPGNVRELENVLERAINFIGSDGRILEEHLPKRITGLSQHLEICSMREAVEQAEKEAVSNALIQCRYRKNKAAELLGISRTTLYEKMVKYGVSEKRSEIRT